MAKNPRLAELKDSRLTASQNRIVSSLTKKQIDEYKEAFLVFDKDGDGHITPNEMEAALKAMGATPTQAEVRDIINEFDLDGNGRIDFNEFLVMMAMQHDTEDDYLAAFQAMDRDNDGMITIAEMNKLLDGIGLSLTVDERKAIFGTFDRNGDGEVSFEEFSALMKKSSQVSNSKKKNTPYTPEK